MVTTNDAISTLVIPNMTTNRAGLYDVVANNSSGSADQQMRERDSAAFGDRFQPLCPRHHRRHQLDLPAGICDQPQVRQLVPLHEHHPVARQPPLSATCRIHQHPTVVPSTDPHDGVAVPTSMLAPSLPIPSASPRGGGRGIFPARRVGQRPRESSQEGTPFDSRKNRQGPRNRERKCAILSCPLRPSRATTAAQDASWLKRTFAPPIGSPAPARQKHAAMKRGNISVAQASNQSASLSNERVRPRATDEFPSLFGDFDLRQGQLQLAADLLHLPVAVTFWVSWQTFLWNFSATALSAQ